MADNKNYFGNTVDSLFGGLGDFINTKTVVGEPVTINGTIIVPLIEVNFGSAASASERSAKTGSTGGLFGKMKPCAVLVINGSNVRMVPVDQPTGAVAKIIDLVPNVLDRFGKKDPDVEAKVNDIIKGE